MKKSLIESFFYGICVASGLGLLLYSFSTRYSESMLFPRVILFCWIVCASIALIQALSARQILQEGKEKRVLLCVAAMIFFVLALTPLGFLPTTFIFFCLYALALGLNRKTLLFPVAALMTLSIWLIFEKLFEASLPAGLFLS